MNSTPEPSSPPPPIDPPALRAPRGKRPWRLALVIVVALLFVGVDGFYRLFVVVEGRAPVWYRSTAVCTQPDSVAYDSRPYAVYASEPAVALAFDGGSAYAVVSRLGNGRYGVYVELNPTTDPRRLTCRWTPDRVEIIEPNGMTHTVPADVFKVKR